MHRYDQNFPRAALDRLEEFTTKPDVLANPASYGELIREVKLECILATENSPYIEVRANVDPFDDFAFGLSAASLPPGGHSSTRSSVIVTLLLASAQT